MPKHYPQPFRDLVADTFLNTKLTLQQVGDMYGIYASNVRLWSIKKDREKYYISKGRNRSLFMAQEIIEARPNIRRTELADLLGVPRSTVETWHARGKISLDIVCEICGEASTTKYCRECIDKKWDHYYRTYGLTYEQLKAMPTACEVCGSEDRLHVDHDHATGRYRGVLCHHCNVALGMVKDEIETLEKLIKYIKRNNN